MEFIDLKSQQVEIKPELDRRMAAVLAHGRYITGPEVQELEERLQEYTGAKHCVTVASGNSSCQTRTVNWEVEQRMLLGERYNQLIDQAGIERVRQKDDRTSVFAQYTIYVHGRDALRLHLHGAGIPTAAHHPRPLNEQMPYLCVLMPV